MRRRTRLSLAVVSVAAVLAGSAAAGSAMVANAQTTAPGQRPSAAIIGGPSGGYPNLFAELGHSQQEIDAKLSAAWQQLFHGTPGAEPERRDGQSVYYQLNSEMAYVEDIANRDVRSEGMGYAMMIALQLDHQKEFNALWNFAKSKMQLQSGNSKYYFAWHTDTSGRSLGSGVAPDGDEWIAAALALAGSRWGSGQGIYNYTREAEQIIRAMWHQSDSGGVNMFDRRTYLPVFSPPGAVGYTDPSYCLPAFYKIFAAVVPADKALWDKAYTAAQQLLQKAANAKTGLAPCYANFDGSPYPSSGDVDAYGRTFQEDAWRAIANANLDAAWFGVQPWQTQYSNTLEAFFAARGVTTYVSRYRLDGTPVARGQNTYEPAHAEGLVAMNSTSAISATHTARLDFVRDFWNTKIPSGYARYYDGLLYLLGLLYDSGNFRIW